MMMANHLSIGPSPKEIELANRSLLYKTWDRRLVNAQHVEERTKSAEEEINNVGGIAFWKVQKSLIEKRREDMFKDRNNMKRVKIRAESNANQPRQDLIRFRVKILHGDSTLTTSVFPGPPPPLATFPLLFAASSVLLLQERLLESFNEMETINESGYLTEDEMDKLAKNERMAINISNLANLVLFIAKVYASIESRSLAVIASTLDSLLDLLSGFILWFTSHAMRNPNHYHCTILSERRGCMQPVVSQSV